MAKEIQSEEVAEAVKEEELKKAFITNIQEVEKKHGYNLMGVLHFSQNGVVPQITVVKSEVKSEEDK